MQCSAPKLNELYSLVARIEDEVDADLRITVHKALMGGHPGPNSRAPLARSVSLRFGSRLASGLTVIPRNRFEFVLDAPLSSVWRCPGGIARIEAPVARASPVSAQRSPVSRLVSHVSSLEPSAPRSQSAQTGPSGRCGASLAPLSGESVASSVDVPQLLYQFYTVTQLSPTST